MATTFKYALSLIIGIALGTGFSYLQNSPANETDTGCDKQDEPLYWVTPMDANYRRDEPGKSPMGMDLVPVYAERDQAGVIEISPQVINNLGVRKSTVERTSLHQDIRTVGYVKYDQDRLIHIHTRVEGWIEKLKIKAAGDPVAKG